MAGGATGMSLVDVRRLWPDVLEAVKSRRRFTWVILSQNAHVAAFDGSTLTVGLVNAGARDRFLSSGSEEILRQALTEALGVDWRVEAIVDANPAPKSTGSAPAGASTDDSSTDSAPTGSTGQSATRSAPPATEPANPAAPESAQDQRTRLSPEPGEHASGSGTDASDAGEPQAESTPAGNGSQSAAPAAAAPQGSDAPKTPSPEPAETPDSARDPESTRTPESTQAPKRTRAPGFTRAAEHRSAAAHPAVSASADELAHPDDPTVEDIGHDELLARELGAQVIEEIPHE